MTKLLTVRETAEALRVTSETVRTMIRQKRIPAFRVGGHLYRVSADAVEKMLEPCQQEAS